MKGRVGRWRLACVLVVIASGGGCERAKPAPAKPMVPVAIRRPDAKLRVFSGDDETPPASYEFEGARGSVRVTMEFAAGPESHPAGPTINDVSFKAEGAGRVWLAFQRPTPGHPNGRVTIRCRSGQEESAAEFEPELWYHQPGAIVSFESDGGEGIDRAQPGREVVLGRYVARNIPRDIRLTFKAAFTRDPVAPRTKAGPRTAR